ncbi:MAG: hypothetical protein AAGL18_13115, partial [Pseudomonadota bacterium]
MFVSIAVLRIRNVLVSPKNLILRSPKGVSMDWGFNPTLIESALAFRNTADRPACLAVGGNAADGGKCCMGF